MNSSASYLTYRETGSFSKLVADYIDGAAALQPFLQFAPNLEGIKKAIAARRSSDQDNRQALVAQLNKQYEGVETSDLVRKNINALANDNAYTICTAHQPNLFTGHLYFVYKILHAVKLAAELSHALPAERFVPVFYMGSEDADLEELGQVTIQGKKLTWQTGQKGAVGRMIVDNNLIKLIDEIDGQLSVEKYGKEIITLLRKCYVKGQTIEQSTFLLVNYLFQEFGLLVLLPDNAALKRLFIATVEKELAAQFSNKAVTATIAEFPLEYKVQAAGRELNLFYLKDDMRERIERSGDTFTVTNTNISFTPDEIKAELHSFPERFSPNVITRPLYQEIILPNLAFIGGGAELAYWLELKQVFTQAGVPFPVLILRNSFMLIDQKTQDRIEALHFTPTDFFGDELDLVARLVSMKSQAKLSLEEEKNKVSDIYKQIAGFGKEIDPTLEKHVNALSAQALNRLGILEKKLLKVEKRKFEAEQRQIAKVRSALFPGGSLQERVDNLLPYYARFGPQLMQSIYDHSKGLEMKFCILNVCEA